MAAKSTNQDAYVKEIEQYQSTHKKTLLAKMSKYRGFYFMFLPVFILAINCECHDKSEQKTCYCKDAYRV